MCQFPLIGSSCLRHCVQEDSEAKLGLRVESTGMMGAGNGIAALCCLLATLTPDTRDTQSTKESWLHHSVLFSEETTA